MVGHPEVIHLAGSSPSRTSAAVNPPVNSFIGLSGVDGANATIVINVQLTLTPPPPGIPTLGAVVNAANLQAPRLYPDEIVILVGAGLGPPPA